VQAREIIARTARVPGANVMISATHSHTGPVLDTGSARKAIDGGGTDAVRAYTAAFTGSPEFETPSMHDDIVHAWHLYTLRLRDASPLSRDQFVEELKSRNIGASVHFIPLHTHPYYRATYGYRSVDFPVAVQEYRREISLPIYSRMTDADVRSVIDATFAAVKQSRSKSDYARA